MTEETLVPLDESDLIAHCGRQDQKIRELEAALAEKEEDWQLKYDLLTHDYEQKWGLSNRLQEQIAVLEMAVKVFQDDTIMKKAHIEHLEGQTAALTDELGTVKEILRQLNDRDKRLREALEKPHRDCDPLRIING